jgi:hypothetical protein
MLGELPRGIKYRYELLIGHHGGDQRLGGHRQETALEGAGNGDWPLGEIGQLVQQLIVQPRRATEGSGHPRHLLADALPTLIRIGQHPGGTHGIEPAVRIRHVHGFGMHETMPA